MACHKSWFANAPAKKTIVGPWPEDCQARGPSRVSSISDSMGIKHTAGMLEGQEAVRTRSAGAGRRPEFWPCGPPVQHRGCAWVP